MTFIATDPADTLSAPLDAGSPRCGISAAMSAPGPVAAPRLSSDALFGDGHEIEIVHGLAVYRLRITSLGKLILTK